jgi:acetyl-CoA acetyltransferase
VAGVGPYDLDVVEIHDGFACEEIVHYEDLELCPRGDGITLLRSGATSLGGRIPVRPSGGLLSLGHSPSASGVRNIGEVALHLRESKKKMRGFRLNEAQKVLSATLAHARFGGIIINTYKMASAYLSMHARLLR